MKKKQIIRLTESDLHRIVKDVANKILNENMKFVHVHSCKCPNCGANLYNYIWNPQNIIHTSDRYEHFDVDGFRFCRNAYYKCPNCVTMGSGESVTNMVTAKKFLTQTTLPT